MRKNKISYIYCTDCCVWYQLCW